MTKALTYRIGADLGDLARSMDEGVRKSAMFKRELAELEKQQRQHRAAITDLGQGMASFGTAVAVGLGLATKAAISWESAFAGVRKTVDGSDEEIAALEGELRNLARTLPATHEEIAGVAEAAGQLGIKRQDIAEFTKTMVALGVSTNLSAEEAATALAKFSNIMGTSASDVSRLGSALVALGNDGASTEQDIINMGLRIASAGRVVGLTEAQVLSFASSLSSVGIEAEAGGTAFSTVMIKIANATRRGGDALDVFAQVAGISSDKFAQEFGVNAADTITLFIQGLRRMQMSGQDVFGVLDQLGLIDARVRNALLSAAGAADMFTHSLDVGNTAWAENTALAEEAEKRYATAASRLKVSGNQIKDAMIDVGAAIAPLVAGAAQGVADIARAFSELPDPIKNVVAMVGAAAVGITLVGGAALIAAPKVLAFRESMRTLEATGGAAGGALGKFGLFMSGPFGAALAGVTIALGIWAAASGAASRRQQELADAGRSVADAIKEQDGAINQSVRQTTAKVAAEKGLLDDAEKLGIALPDVTNAILQQGGAYDDLNGKLTVLSDGRNRSREDMQKDMHVQVEAARHLKSGIDDLVAGKNKELNATRQASEAGKEHAGVQQSEAKSTERLRQELKEAEDALNGLIEALNKYNGITLSAREAQRGYLTQLQETTAAADKVTQAERDSGAALDNNTEKGRANAEALDAQAKNAGDLAEALAKEAEKQGGATAGAAAFKASLDASRPALIANAEKMGMSHDAAVRYADAVLSAADITANFSNTTVAELKRVADAVHAVPPGKSINVGVLSEEAKARLAELGYQVRTLPDGTVEVIALTAGAQTGLNQFISRNQNRTIGLRAVVTAYGPSYLTGAGTILNRMGNIVSFAGGGTWENHAPQVVQARPGTVRVWAEPDTARESYIPWAMDRRPRATSVLGQTADAFGYSLTPKSQMVAFGRGGVTGSSAGGSWTVNLYAGVVGSERELHNWLARSIDSLRSKGRV
jgi:TP901 family phage tail tape measure protein